MERSKIFHYRESLDFLDDGLFLNYAATAPLTKSVISEIQSATEQMKKPLGQYFYQALNRVEFARRQMGELLNALPKELAFTQNTSTAVSTIALSIPWKAGDRVLVANNEFPSNYFPWVNLKSRGVVCETFQPEANVPLCETLAKIDLKGVRLISISAVSYETGRLYELEAFTRFCRERGILSCIDAIQAIGAVPLNIGTLGVDFMATGAQKWLMGPVGCGMIYANARHLETLEVPYVGWTSLKYPEYMDLGALEFSTEMTRFEPGLPSYLSIVGLAKSLTELQTIGAQTIHSCIQKNTAYLQKNLRALNLELLTGEKDLTAGITSFRLPEGYDHRQMQEAYGKRKVFITSRKDYVRVAPHFFNETSELDQFLEVTEDLLKRSAIRAPRVELKNAEAAQVPATSEVSGALGKVLITGATGGLAPDLARNFLKRGAAVHLVGRTLPATETVAQQLRTEFPQSTITADAADFSSPNEFSALTKRLEQSSTQQKFSSLVNCASVADVGLFHEESLETARHSMQVNVVAPMELMHLFLTTLKAPNALGILNVVSSTGRCGSPLLASYSAGHAALWTFGETLAREWADQNLTITTFVAPAMHSPLQKRMGRIALRYFKMTGSFDYDTPDRVAVKAVECFISKKAFHLSTASRAKILMNAFRPEFVSAKIKKVWRDGEK